jgi:hypothetical protein
MTEKSVIEQVVLTTNEPFIFNWKLNLHDCNTSIFEKKKMTEHTDIKKIYGFIKNNLGIAYEGIKRYKYIPYKTELDQMIKYKECYSKRTKTFQTSFYLPNHKWGRINPTSYTSLSIYHRPTRHSLCKDIYIDIDMVNAQVSIIVEICKHHHISVPALERYVENTVIMREAIMKFHSVSKDVAKNLPITIIFGGSYSGWIKEHNVDINNDKRIEDFEEIENELKQIMEIVYSSNKDTIEKTVLIQKPDKWKDFHAKKRGVMALWCQTIERILQETSILFLVNEKGFKIEDIVPCQDGFMILKDLWYDGILKDCEKIIFDKFKIHLQYVVKPFDEAIEIPLYDYDDDDVIEAFPLTSSKKPEKKTSASSPKRNVSIDKIKALCNIIDDKFICTKGYYADWCNIIWSLRSESPDYKEIARELSKKTGANFNDAVFEATWDSYTEGKMNIDKFYNYAKKSNPEKYAEIMHSDTQIRHCNSDLEAASIIFEDLKRRLKSVDGRFFFLRDNIWISDMEAVRSALTYETMNSNIYTEMHEKTYTYSPYVQNISKARHVVDALLLKVTNENNDRNLYHNFHMSTKGKICFNDGVLDFKAKTFTLWDDVDHNEIFSTLKIERNFKDYFDNPNRAIIEELKENVLKPLYGKKIDTALHFLSRALAGHHEDKRWATYLGNRSCGKSLEYDILSRAFEQYVTTFELGNMLYCRKTTGLENVDCSKRLYWLMDLEFVRLAVSQEIPESKSGLIVNSKILKKITGGGDTIVARRCYDRRDTHFLLDTTFYFKGNYSLLTDSPDCDETRLEFESVVQFKSKEEIEMLRESCEEDTEMDRYRLADPMIKQKCRDLEWMNAMVYLIFENYQERPVNILRLPDDDDEESRSLQTALKSRFEFTKDDTPMLAAEVMSIMLEFDKKKVENELAARNVFKKKHIKRDDFRQKWCYYGIKKKLSDEKTEM